MPYCVCYVTCADAAEARRIAAALVAERLAACGNMIEGMRSVYRWQGQIETATECVLLLKTRSALVDELSRRVKALHSYECPCVVALPIEGGHGPYLDWIAAETRES
ncbi:divalent-cation tolerance protein CutA [Geminicoccaceae bacterium 1502E]|nr:divalent-cation tolerance protein CutA [Geminicoccaceae bacterium 1502E]